MFLCANAGPWFVVLGAIFTDKVIVQHLTDYIWIGMDAVLNESHCRKVTHIMQTLQKGICRLRAYYTSLQHIPLIPGEAHPRYFPSICSYLDDSGGVVQF
jgi:hypothetical protein